MVISKSWNEIADSVSRLRILAWKPHIEADRPGAKLESLVEALDTDPRTTHFVFEAFGDVRGAARVTTGYLPNSILTRVEVSSVEHLAFFSRLVVHPGHQRRGIAHSLDLARIEAVQRQQQTSAWAEASPWRVNAMKSLGFQEIVKYMETEATFVNLEVCIMRLQLRV